jgi:hypothetical protein
LKQGPDACWLLCAQNTRPVFFFYFWLKSKRGEYASVQSGTAWFIVRTTIRQQTTGGTTGVRVSGLWAQENCAIQGSTSVHDPVSTNTYPSCGNIKN